MVLLLYIYSIYILTVFTEGAAVAEAQEGSWLLPGQLSTVLLTLLLLWPTVSAAGIRLDSDAPESGVLGQKLQFFQCRYVRQWWSGQEVLSDTLVLTCSGLLKKRQRESLSSNSAWTPRVLPH